MSKTKITEPKKAVIFARVSTQEQYDEGCSIESQIRLMEDYCKKRNLEIIKRFEVVETSTRGNRTQFNDCLEFIRNQNEKIALVSDKVDRLQRSILDVPKLDKLVQEGKATLDFLDIGRLDDDSNAQQKAFYRMAVVFANAYTDAISDNVRRSNHNKRLKGTIQKDSPLGYINEPRNRTTHPEPIVVIDEQRAPFVIKAFEMYASGCYAVDEITKILNKEGLTQKRGVNEGKPVTNNLIDKMLTIRFYYGEDESFKYNVIFKHPYPTLITKDLYDKCQEIRQSRGRGLAKANEEELKEQQEQANQTIVDKSTQRIFLYRGMIKCSSCDCTYSPEAKTKQVIKEEFKNTPTDTLTPDCYETKEYIYLRPVKRRNNCSDCKSTNEEYINAQIEKMLETIHIDKTLIEAIKPDIQKELDKNTDYKLTRISLIDKNLSDLNRRKQNLLDMRTGGEITKEEFIPKNTSFERQITDLTTEKEQLIQNSTLHKQAIIDIFNIASNIKDIYKSSDTTKKRAILKILCPNLKLDGKNLCIHWRKPLNLLVPKEVNMDWLPGQDSNLRPIG